MPLVCLGLSHRTAPVDVRERHAFPASKMGEALIALRDSSFLLVLSPDAELVGAVRDG